MIDLRNLIVGGIVLFASSAVIAQETAAPEPAADAVSAVADVTATLTLSLDATGDIERHTVNYQCDNGEGYRVHYVNASPNFLALLQIEGETHIFATALSASGARYVSGPYEWWSKGDEATLRDLRSEETDPPLATCLSAVNTP